MIIFKNHDPTFEIIKTKKNKQKQKKNKKDFPVYRTSDLVMKNEKSSHL